jgi:hypothetical protein
MKTNEITPNDSACPVFLDPIDEAQIAADQLEIQEREAAKAERLATKAALLERLGITAEEAALLLS